MPPFVCTVMAEDFKGSLVKDYLQQIILYLTPERLYSMAEETKPYSFQQPPELYLKIQHFKNTRFRIHNLLESALPATPTLPQHPPKPLQRKACLQVLWLALDYPRMAVNLQSGVSI